MKHKSRVRLLTSSPSRWVAAVGLTALLGWLPTKALAAPVPLTQSDVALALYTSPDGTTWNSMASSALAGFFGPHRCLCSDTVMVTLLLTASGQTSLGSSTIAANFLLGANCVAAPASCASLGQVSFSATQSAASPTFSSNLVFQAVAGGATVSCGSLTAGSTTLWAVIAQDGVALSFVPAIQIPVITATVAAPTAVTAQPGSEGILVAWTPPVDTSLVAAYQVLCLPRPAAASTLGYEKCGLTIATGSTSLTPSDPTELCSDTVPVGTNSVRVAGLANGTPYTLAVVAIDPSGGVSPVSPQVTATPQPTMGFIEKYKQDGGAATGCSLSPSPTSNRASLSWIAIVAALVLVLVSARCTRRGRRRKPGTLAMLLVLALAAKAQAQGSELKENDDWAANATAARTTSAPEWSFELGISLYRPAIDAEFAGGAHPYADTFGNSRHLMSETEIDRYLGRRFGTWGLGLRAGYYKATAAALLVDGTRSGDETGLRLIPISFSLLYRANEIPGLKSVPLIPYLKAGLDGVFWTASKTASASKTGFSPGWHAAAGMSFGLNRLGNGVIHEGALADPCALFFEWDYAAINGLGFGGAMHVGDSTWFAGLMFDL